MSSQSLPLSGAVVLLAADHYDAPTSELLESIAKTLGATMTTTRENSTMLIINVHSPKWETEREHLRFLQSEYPQLPQPDIRSYHWLIACGKENRLLDEAELQYSEPFMVYPKRERYPLKVWVSKNVSRHAGETPEEALVNVTSQLEAAGAISLKKRKFADVLVVDTSSEFYKTVKKEKVAHGRTWQKIVQREWVEYCIKEQVVEIRHVEDEVQEEVNAGEDSFVEEEPGPVRSGPGRPTGKPRIEYTPADTDFLCRWLAAFYPEGSWSSRKTFTVLVADEDRYPIAARHSPQSWHEHFKKQANSLSNRVRRFADADIDEQLFTRDERHAEREKKLREKAEREASDGAEGEPVAGPSRRSPVPPPPVLVDERQLSPAGPAAEAPDTENEPSQTSTGGDAGHATATRAEVDTFESETRATLVSQALEVPVPETATLATSSNEEVTDTRDPALPSDGSQAPTQSASVSLPDGHSVPTVSIANEQTTVEEGSVAQHGTAESDRALVDETPVEQSGDIVRTETQFTVTAETVEVLVPETVVRPNDLQDAGAHRDNAGSHADPAAATQPAASSSKAARSPSSMRAPELIPQPSASGTPAKLVPGDSGHVGGPANLETPSPARNDAKRQSSDRPEGSTPLREELQRSRDKRQRTAERLAQREGQGGSTNRLSKRAQSPDRVYASIKLPIRKPTPDLAAAPARARTPPRPLTPAEWQEGVVRGQQIATDLATEYRNRVTRLTQKYNITPADIAAASNAIRKRTGAPADWKTLEGVLAERHRR